MVAICILYAYSKFIHVWNMNGIYNQDWYMNGTSFGLVDGLRKNIWIVDQNWEYIGYVIHK